jgi:hypothetical protein
MFMEVLLAVATAATCGRLVFDFLRYRRGR